MKTEIQRKIRDFEYEEREAEKELKMAVSNRQWSEVLRLAQSLCEYRTARWSLEDIFERIEESNQPAHN